MQTTFAAEAPEVRAGVLERLATGLSAADEPLLESALDDRRREVRAVAAAQLAHLPSSALAARMLERARQHVRVERAARERLVVDPPGELDAALLRDGVAKRARAGLGERASWLAGILEATPLAGLQAHLGRAPAEALALPGAEDWHAMLLPALATAAVRQRDAGWAEALLQAGVDRQGLGERAAARRARAAAARRPRRRTGSRPRRPACSRRTDAGARR